MAYKRLEDNSFKWPAIKNGIIRVEPTQVEAEVQSDEHTAAARPAKPRQTNRGSLSKHLERVEVVIEPELSCTCGNKCNMIGNDVSEWLDIIPAQLRVIVNRRPKYACRACGNGIDQAPASAHIIEGGMPTEAALAHVLVCKYADHLPLYRQAQIYSRQRVDLDCSTLAAWVGKSAFELTPIYDALMSDLKQSTRLFMDETPEGNKTGPPGVAFTYAPGRSGEHAEKILNGFSGILQVDGYAGYNRLLKRPMPDITFAYCWAHARRKLCDATQSSKAPIAQQGLAKIQTLYHLEKQIRRQTPDERHAVCREKSKPIIEAFELWLSDGRIEIDNNTVESTILPIALNRKNALFAGHDAGAQNWAVIASLIETCKLNNIEPHGYLSNILTAIAKGHKQTDIKELLPWNYQKYVG